MQIKLAPSSYSLLNNTSRGRFSSPASHKRALWALWNRERKSLRIYDLSKFCSFVIAQFYIWLIVIATGNTGNDINYNHFSTTTKKWISRVIFKLDLRLQNKLLSGLRLTTTQCNSFEFCSTRLSWLEAHLIQAFQARKFVTSWARKHFKKYHLWQGASVVVVLSRYRALNSNNSTRVSSTER